MLKQCQTQSYFISQSLLCKYEAKKLYQIQSTLNRIVFLTQTYLIAINPAQSNKYKLCIKIESQNVLRYKVNKQNQICILYNNGVMEIRNLDNKGQILHKFVGIQGKIVKHFPNIYWDDQDIYILNQNRLELININKKQRKLYSQLCIGNQDSVLIGIVESRLINRQRIILTHFNNKLIFNIVPIPITELSIKNITRIMILSQYKYRHPTFINKNNKNSNNLYSNNKVQMPREYLVVIIENCILQIYNLINMRQLIQIKYQNTGNQILTVSTDKSKVFMLVKFITKKNKVVRNILYKINTDYYYGNINQNNIDKYQQNFFQYEFQLDLKEHFILFPPRQLIVENNKFISLEMCYFKHNAKRNKGQIMLCSFIINPVFTNRKLTNAKVKMNQWKQLRQWKDIITSYIQMKDSLEFLDFGFDDQDQDFQGEDNSMYMKAKDKDKDSQKEITKEKQIQKQRQKQRKKQNEKKIQTTKQNNQKQLNKIKQYNQMSKKIINQFSKDTTVLLQQHEKQMQKYEKLKTSLVNGAHLFGEQKLDISMNSDQDKKIQQQFYKFMREYLKQQDIDIDPQNFFQIQVENNMSPVKSIENVKTSQSVQMNKQVKTNKDTKQIKQLKQIKKKQDPKEHLKLQLQQKITPIQKQKLSLKKQQKILPISKSSERLTKNISSTSLLNRTKSSTHENENNNQDYINQKLLSSFTDSKQQQQISQKQNENENKQLKQIQQSKYPQHDQYLFAIQNSIKSAFKPLQQKLDKLDQKLQRTQSIHISQLQRIQKLMQKQQKSLNNINSTIHGYCSQLMIQFENNLQKGLNCYWNKIQDIDKKATQNRNKIVDDFGFFIDKQIQARAEIFDKNRISIQNNLTHIRKKIFTQDIQYNNQQQQQWEDDQQIDDITLQEGFKKLNAEGDLEQLQNWILSNRKNLF